MNLTLYSERGQALVIIVLAMVGLIGITGLAIDGSAILAERRHAQNAADTAVLTAALEKVSQQRQGIAPDELLIALAAKERAASNGYDGNLVTNQVDVHMPPISGWYSDCSSTQFNCNNYIQVIITSHVRTFFARVLGIAQMTNRVSAVAVGGDMGGSGIPYDPNVFRALWAGAPPGACNSENYFDWSGNDYTITGGVHSNGDMRIPGNDHIVTGTSTVAGNNTQGSANFDPPLLENTGTVLSNPFETEYTFSRFNTGGDIYAAAAAVNRIVVTNSNINISFLKESCSMNGVICYNENTKVLQDGIYVTTSTSDVSIDISESNIVTGDGGPSDFVNITFASQGGIKLSGSGNKFRTYIGNPNAANTTSFLTNLHGILFATWWNRGGGDSQCKDYVLSTAGNSHQFQGFFYAPNGQVELNGNYENILGCIIAYTVKLNGSNSSITCDGTWFPDTSWSIGIVQ